LGGPVRRATRAAVGAALLAGLLLLAGGATHRAWAERDWAYALPDDLMSPFCPGISLADCPSPQAAELRSWILEQEKEGRTEKAVKAELFQVYGDRLRQAPKAQGVGIVAYAVPAGVFLAGGAVLAAFLARQRRRAAEEAAEPAHPLEPEDRELARIVDEELGR
jgi:cytochrome c-type biogenesis protein CcmH/NrfF